MVESQQLSTQRQHIEIFKLKRLIKKMENLKGNGTALITLIIPSGKSLVEVSTLLRTEYSQAQNIQDKNMKDSVLDANIKIQNKVAFYGPKAPKNGLVVLAGNALEEKVIDFVPWKKMEHFVFKSDDIFHLEKLRDLTSFDEPVYGFIIMDGAGALFAKIQGNSKEILLDIQEHLPNKHNKGGQSSVRFSRLYDQARQGWVRKVAEKAKELFIKDAILTVKGIVLAGSADFKNELKDSNYLDKKIKEKIVATIDVSYGGQSGLVEALDKSKETLTNVQLNQERSTLQELYDHLAKNDDMVVYGPTNTIRMLDSGAIETLIVYENSDLVYMELKNNNNSELSDLHVVQPHEVEKILESNPEFTVEKQMPLVDWIAETQAEAKINIQFVSDRSPEGHQFAKGFQGFAGILRYKMHQDYITNQNMEEYKDEDDDDFI